MDVKRVVEIYEEVWLWASHALDSEDWVTRPKHPVRVSFNESIKTSQFVDAQTLIIPRYFLMDDVVSEQEQALRNDLAIALVKVATGQPRTSTPILLNNPELALLARAFGFDDEPDNQWAAPDTPSIVGRLH